jgi:sigma-B regulation protein RsbU (phosphoserine phosphatase)
MNSQPKHRVRKIFYLVVGFGLLLLALVFDVVSKTIDIDTLWINLLRDLIVIGGFGSLFLFMNLYWKRESVPLKRLTAVMILAFVVMSLAIFINFISAANFEIKSNILIPNTYATIFIADVVSMVFGLISIIFLLSFRDILFYKRRSYTKRNFLLLVISLIAVSLSTVNLKSYDSRLISYILYGIYILMVLLNSFRLTWVVYLPKKDKVLTILYSFLSLIFFVTLSILTSRGSDLGKFLLYYSYPLQYFTDGTALFGAIYFGMTFFGTLFHLPTADAFDRKLSEVSSLHNLSKLVTQVFDFNELVSTVTKMTLSVCEAKSSWLEVIQSPEQSKFNILQKSENKLFRVVANNNISVEEIAMINSSNNETLRDSLLNDRKAIIIPDISEDKRTRNIKIGQNKIGSMLVVPLIAHEELIGVLYATKDIEYGFDREDLEVVSAFGDQAAIAIDNSRLIEKSLERERLVREMTVAQEMQKKLLPQQLPKMDVIDFDALSTPAFEVGGDYYDYLILDNRYLAVVIGDVSGKGVSAAFYMAEMKGVFQSLCHIYPTPKEFIMKANAAISTSIDKKSFVSLIYTVLDSETGILTSIRAGHCPFILASKDGVRFVRPNGMAIGMGTPKLFDKFVEEDRIQLECGDVCVFYTDGITEAQQKDGVEFGYDKLLEVVQSNYHRTALEIRDEIISAVNRHMNNESPEDDITLVILKWLKK